MLLTIMDYVFAPATTADKADYVAMLVEDFLTELRELQQLGFKEEVLRAAPELDDDSTLHR